MEEIKTCPFCGRVPKMPRHLSDGATYEPVDGALKAVDRYEVWVMECGSHAMAFGRSAENAIERWNTRVE